VDGVSVSIHTSQHRGKAASSIDTRDDRVARSSAGLALVLG
jgi:hypothetical protein